MDNSSVAIEKAIWFADLALIPEDCVNLAFRGRPKGLNDVLEHYKVINLIYT